MINGNMQCTTVGKKNLPVVSWCVRNTRKLCPSMSVVIVVFLGSTRFKSKIISPCESTMGRPSALANPTLFHGITLAIFEVFNVFILFNCNLNLSRVTLVLVRVLVAAAEWLFVIPCAWDPLGDDRDGDELKLPTDVARNAGAIQKTDALKPDFTEGFWSLALQCK